MKKTPNSSSNAKTHRNRSLKYIKPAKTVGRNLCPARRIRTHDISPFSRICGIENEFDGVNRGRHCLVSQKLFQSSHEPISGLIYL